LSLIAFFFASEGEARGGETWGEKLGFPAKKRVIIFHANDMGGLYEFNCPGQELLRKGRIQSVGVTVVGPWFHEFAHWCREHPGHDVGLALTMVSPSPLFRWKPVSRRDEVPSLVDASGYLWPSAVDFATRADAGDVAREIQAQIDQAKAAGINPTHLLTFQGGLLLRPDLLEVYLKASEENGIPAVMIELSPENLAQLEKEGIELDARTRELIDGQPMAKIDAAADVPDADTYEAKKERFKELVRNLSPGISQIFVAPSDPSKGLERLSLRAKQRVWDRQLLNDEDVLSFLRDEKILFTNWIEIQERYEHRNNAHVSP
jgi:predicted glycoside hydrolase/deacetylase ChbG (UPF0249 family)